MSERRGHEYRPAIFVLNVDIRTGIEERRDRGPPHIQHPRSEFFRGVHGIMLLHCRGGIREYTPGVYPQHQQENVVEHMNV